MLSPLVLQSLQIYWNCYAVLSLVPLGWIGKRPFVKESKWRIFRWLRISFVFGSLALQTATSINFAKSFIQALVAGNVVWASMDFFFAAAYPIVSPIQLILYLKRHEMAMYVRKLLEIDTILTDQAVRNPPKKPRIDFLELFVTVLPPGVAVFVLLFPALCLWNPEHPRYFYHWIPKELKNGYTLSAYLMLELYKYMVVANSAMLPAILIVVQCYVVTGWIKWSLREERRKWSVAEGTAAVDGAWSADEQEVERRKRHAVFASLRILNIIFKNAVSDGMWAMLFLVVIVAGAYAIYCTVIVRHHFPVYLQPTFPIMALLILFYVYVAFYFLGNVFDCSKLLVVKMRDGVEDAGMLKEYLGWRPLEFKIWGCVSIRRTTALDMYAFIISAAVNAMLLHA